MDVAAHLEHPGAERHFRLIGMPVLQNTIEDILHQVFGDAAAGGKVQEEMEERPLMAVEELRQLPDVARANFPHDLFVFHFASVYVMEYWREAKRLRIWDLVGTTPDQNGPARR